MNPAEGYNGITIATLVLKFFFQLSSRGSLPELVEGSHSSSIEYNSTKNYSGTNS
jgi:hypothetical protein